MALSTLFIWVALLLPLVLLLWRKRKTGDNRELRRLPPSPPKLPILGNLHQLGAIPHNSFWKLSKKYGSVLLLHLGRTRVLIISSAVAARDVLKVHDLACCNRPQLAGCQKAYLQFSRHSLF
ncbi:hypothetical protein SLA2020_362850, partial [Shorea laevis]